MQALKKFLNGVDYKGTRDLVADIGIGEQYNHGVRCEKDLEFQQAATWFQKAAKQGYAEAQYKLGMYYKEGKGGLGPDPEEAAKWLQKAAAQNHPGAQFELAMFYNEGKGGLKPDHDEAVKWLQKAAAQNHPGAQFELGMYYKEDKGDLKPDHDEAVKWLQKAAAQNHPGAQFELGIYYYEGKGGLRPDHKEAAKWFQEAADQGHCGAQYELGFCYNFGGGVVKKCLAVAIIYYQLAAAQKDTNAEKMLSRMGENAIQRNRLKPGEDPYTLDDLKNPDIQCQIGKRYQFGDQDTEQDLQVAVAWYQKAADQGYGEAQYRLGMCHRNGIGTAKNEERASYWLAKSNERGYAPATAAQKFANKKQVFTIDEETDKEIHDHCMTGYTKK